jgi:hypothetical protein
VDLCRMSIGIVLSLSLTAAIAQAGEGPRERGHAADGGAARARHNANVSPETDEGRMDAGPPPMLNLTPEQAEFRDKLVGQQRLFVRDMVRAAGKHISAEERQDIEHHWRRVMRLLRIRELAEQENDAAVVRRADELRDREDEKFVTLMQRGADASAPTVQGDGAVK